MNSLNIYASAVLLTLCLNLSAFCSLLPGPLVTSANSIVMADGSIDPAFGADVTEGAGHVYETAVQPDGKIIMVGLFQGANSANVGNVARFNSDGTLDNTFNPGTGSNGGVYAVAIQSDGKILLGGVFTSFAGQAVARIVRLNVDGSIDATFISGVSFNSDVRDIAIQSDGKILVGGLFTALGSKLIRLNADGSVDAAIGGFSAAVLAIVVMPSGKIMTGGDRGGPGMAIRRINVDGSADPTFTPGTGPNSTVLRLAIQPDGKILASGTFTACNGVSTDGLVRINDNGSVDTTFDHLPSAAGNIESGALALQSDGKILVGYNFNIDTFREGKVIRFNSDGSLDSSFMSGDLDASWCFDIRQLPGNKILAVGVFIQYNGQPKLHAVELNSGGSIDSSFNASISVMAIVRTIAPLANGKILIGGDFEFVNGIRTPAGLARLNSDGGLDTTFQIEPGTYGPLNTFFVQPDGKILIGSSWNGLMRLNPDGSRDISFVVTYAPGYSVYPVRAIGMQSSGKIIVAGTTTGPSGSLATAVRFNQNGSPDTFTALNYMTGSMQTVLIQPDDKIILGGTFSSSASFPRTGIGRVESDGALSDGFTAAGGFVYSLAKQPDGQIISAGTALTRFSSDGVPDSTLNTGTGFNNIVQAAIPQSNGKILAGGQFTTYNGVTVNRILRLNADGSPDTSFVTSGTPGAVYSLATQADGKSLVGGKFWNFGGGTKRSLVRLLASAPIIRAPFDFDGDSKTDISIFRPNAPAGAEWWWLKSSNGGNGATAFGTSSDKLAPVDFTGDGKTDVAFWRPSSGQWFVLRSEDSSFYAFPFGATGDVPVPADYDGDGMADAAVFRESSVTWFISKSSGGTDIVTFGAAGDKPVNADYDGDGKADIAIYRPNGANGSEWWIRRSSNGGVFATQFGTATDKAVAGDYTGDGKADVAFWRPSTGFWNILRSEDFSYYAFPFGSSADVPVPGDYDGDGKLDAAVFRPSTSTWFANRSTAGVLIQQFGTTGDLPVPNAFVR